VQFAACVEALHAGLDAQALLHAHAYDLEPSPFVVVLNPTTVPRSHSHFVVDFNIVTFLPLYLLAQTHGVWF
jgi:hypothetical protein